MITHLKATLVDCYAYREVLYNIFSRDLKLKYKHTVLGYFWSLLNPILQLAVLSLVFSHVVRWGQKDYTLYLFSGLLVWTVFQNSLISAAYVYIENENFIKKIYLPKMIFPLSKVFFRMVDFLFSLVALSLVGLIMGFKFTAAIAALPAAIALLFVFTLGFSLFVAVVTVYFRDFQYLLNVFLQLLYFATPILYPLSAIPPKYQIVLKLNPLYSQVALFQKLVYVGAWPTLAEWGAAAATALGALILGIAVLLLREDDLVFRM